MPSCIGTTAEGLPCKRRTRSGTLCAVHHAQRNRRRVLRVLWLVGVIVACVAFFAHLAQIGQFLHITPPQLSTSATPAAILNELLNQRPPCVHTKSLPALDLVAIWEAKCKNLPPGKALATCRLLLGQFYTGDGRYQQALAVYNLARDGSVEMGDAYYARGNLFYELAVVDLARRGRIHINANALSATADVDDRILKLFSLVEFEYNEAAHRQLFSGVVPVQVSAFRLDQIRAVSAGAKQISFHKLELPEVVMLILCLNPRDATLQASGRHMLHDIYYYMRDHPNEFPGVPPEIWKALR